MQPGHFGVACGARQHLDVLKWSIRTKFKRVDLASENMPCTTRRFPECVKSTFFRCRVFRRSDDVNLHGAAEKHVLQLLPLMYRWLPHRVLSFHSARRILILDKIAIVFGPCAFLCRRFGFISYTRNLSSQLYFYYAIGSANSEGECMQSLRSVPLQKHGLKALPKMHFLGFVYFIFVIPVYFVLVVIVYSIDPTGRFFAFICLQWLHMQAYVS